MFGYSDSGNTVSLEILFGVRFIVAIRHFDHRNRFVDGKLRGRHSAFRELNTHILVACQVEAIHVEDIVTIGVKGHNTHIHIIAIGSFFLIPDDGRHSLIDGYSVPVKIVFSYSDSGDTVSLEILFGVRFIVAIRHLNHRTRFVDGILRGGRSLCSKTNALVLVARQIHAVHIEYVVTVSIKGHSTHIHIIAIGSFFLIPDDGRHGFINGHAGLVKVVLGDGDSSNSVFLKILLRVDIIIVVVHFDYRFFLVNGELCSSHSIFLKLHTAVFVASFVGIIHIKDVVTIDIKGHRTHIHIIAVGSLFLTPDDCGHGFMQNNIAGIKIMLRDSNSGHAFGLEILLRICFVVFVGNFDYRSSSINGELRNPTIINLLTHIRILLGVANRNLVIRFIRKNSIVDRGFVRCRITVLHQSPGQCQCRLHSVFGHKCSNLGRIKVVFRDFKVSIAHALVLICLGISLRIGSIAEQNTRRNIIHNNHTVGSCFAVQSSAIYCTEDDLIFILCINWKLGNIVSIRINVCRNRDIAFTKFASSIVYKGYDSGSIILGTECDLHIILVESKRKNSSNGLNRIIVCLDYKIHGSSLVNFELCSLLHDMTLFVLHKEDLSVFSGVVAFITHSQRIAEHSLTRA